MINSSAVRASSHDAHRIVSIQALRGVAAMMVVLLHMHNVEEKYFHTGYFGFGQYGWMGVDLFFVISGVVMSLVTVGKFESYPNAARFLYHRLARIYPTFWFYYLIVLAAYLYNPMWINAASGHKADLLRSFFLIPNQYENLVGQAWTLSYELTFYILFFLLLLCIPERIVPAVLLACGTAIGVIDYLIQIPHDWHVLWVVTNPFIWEFLAGCFLFQLYRRIPTHSRLGPYFWAFSLTLLGAVVLSTHMFHAGNSAWLKNAYYLRPFLCGIMGASLILGFMLQERRMHIPLLRQMGSLGDWSYSIYLFHEIVAELVARAVNRWWHDLPAAMLFIAVIAVPAIVLTGYLGYTRIEHPLLTRLYRPNRPRAPVAVT